ncbi:organic cation transporter 1-like isoform X1 [Agrilus planipennis]|uniref:Organic cation transporter 1-like isoform X1 n=1 Tax=Agrilus planipennis TaxID=224129 RepID=A0A7F5R676_AGRPL|nr:organic cation transporter 1-like isoform X1 [Agrilus planipennis]
MSYQDALKYVRNLQKIETIPCKNFVHYGNITYGVYQEMSLVCHKRIFEEILDISPQYGILFGQLFVLPLADLFGRKRVIRWGWNALIFSTIMTPSTTFVETIILGRFFAGVGFSAMFLPVQAISQFSLVEISTIRKRPYRFVITYIGAGLSWIITPLLVKNITHWRYLHWVLATPLLLIPLMIWFLPESPLWFISRQMKDKGREILQALKDPVKQEELLLEHMNEKVFKSDTFQNDYRKLRLFFKPGIWLLILLGAITGSVYFKGIFERFIFPLCISRQDYYILSGGIEIVTNLLCIILTLKCNRRHYVIATSLLVTCLGYFAAFALNENSIMHLIMIAVADISSSITYVVISLLITTISSTKYRCTCTGLLNGLGFTMGTIVTNHFQHHLIKKTPALFLVLSIVSFIGSIVSYFSPLINEEDELSENMDDNKTWDP